MLSITGVLNFPIWAKLSLAWASRFWSSPAFVGLLAFATVFVPLFIAAVVISAAIVRRTTAIEFLNYAASRSRAGFRYARQPPWSLQRLYRGRHFARPTTRATWKNGTQVFWMTLIGTFVGELGMNLLAVILAHATGTDNVRPIL